MTEQYWQEYQRQNAQEVEHRQDMFWKSINEALAKRRDPVHHLQKYSMCKSDNQYIRQVQNSPNITLDTVAEIICRDKACELQYCLSLMYTATENRRNIIDLQGCKEQYNTFNTCLREQRLNLIKREQKLRNAVLGIEEPQVLVVEPVRQQQVEEEVVYM